MGRRLGSGTGKQKQFCISLPKEILDPVRKKAADNKNSIASVIRGMVCSELRREGIITDETAATCV